MERILIPGAEIYYDKKFLSPEEATTLLNALRASFRGTSRSVRFMVNSQR